MNTQHINAHKAAMLASLMLLLIAAPLWLYRSNSSNTNTECETQGKLQSSTMGSQMLNPLQLFAK